MVIKTRKKHMLGMLSFLAAFIFTTHAYAQCPPGIPCTAKLPPPNANPPPPPANAAKSDSQACDADFMNQIYARAFLEAEREVVINQTVFRKPDSVLEYTCFDQFVSITANEAGPLFTETTAFKDRKVDISAKGANSAGLLPAAVSEIAAKPLEQLEAILPELSADDFIATLKEAGLSKVKDLSPEALLGPIINFSPSQIQDKIKELPKAIQKVIENQIEAVLPPEIRQLVSSNPLANAEELITGIKTLDPLELSSRLKDVAGDPADLLNLLPDNVRSGLNVQDIVNTYADKTLKQVQDSLSKLKNATTLPSGTLTGIFDNIKSVADKAKALGAISPAELLNFPKTDLKTILTKITPVNMPEFINNLPDISVNALQKDVFIDTLSDYTPDEFAQTYNALKDGAQKAVSSDVIKGVVAKYTPTEAATFYNNLSAQAKAASNVQEALTEAFKTYTPDGAVEALNGFTQETRQQLGEKFFKDTINNMIPSDKVAALTKLSKETIEGYSDTAWTEILAPLSENDFVTSVNNMLPEAREALSGVAITSKLANLPNPTAVVNQLTGQAKNLVQKKIEDALPPAVKNLISGDSFASASEILTDLQNLTPDAALSKIPGLLPDQASKLLTVLPTLTVSNFVPGGLANAVNSFGKDKVEIVKNFTEGIVNSAQIGEFTAIFATDINVDDAVGIFTSFSDKATAAFPAFDQAQIFTTTFTGDEFKTFATSLQGQILGNFDTVAFTGGVEALGAQAAQLFDAFNKDQAIASLNNFLSPSIPSLFSNISVPTLNLSLGSLGTGGITSALNGLGGGSFGFGGGIQTVIPFNVYLGGTKLDTSLQAGVLSSLSKFVNSNFAHDFLGGAAGINSELQTAIGSSNYTCLTMQQVWQLAKCRNFALDDAFLSFKDMTITDPRALPQICRGTTITSALINVAENTNFEYVRFDPVSSHLDLLLPPGVLLNGEKVECGKPVPTGLQVEKLDYEVDEEGNVTIKTIATYDDKVCSNPSCYYDFGNNQCSE